MGSVEDDVVREDDEGFQFKVKIDFFWMGVYEFSF